MAAKTLLHCLVNYNCPIGMKFGDRGWDSVWWKGVTFLVRAKPTKGGGNTDILTDKDRKRRKRLLKVMTKLKGPRHQVTLSQRADNKLYLLAAAMTLAQLVKIMLARDS